MKTPTVQSLRKAGNKVRVIHYRAVSKRKLLPAKEVDPTILKPKGGKTVVDITTPDGKELTGEAVCSNKDSFNRKMGLAIAVGRALAQA
jgi:hypothetical protein